jgi:hypothetical protein
MNSKARALLFGGLIAPVEACWPLVVFQRQCVDGRGRPDSWSAHPVHFVEMGAGALSVLRQITSDVGGL